MVSSKDRTGILGGGGIIKMNIYKAASTLSVQLPGDPYNHTRNVREGNEASWPQMPTAPSPARIKSRWVVCVVYGEQIRHQCSM